MPTERFELDTEQWAVVPRVPTEEMLNVLFDAGLDARDDGLRDLYADLLAAAPRPEAVRQGGAVTDYGSIGQQSEFIQLFNAAFEALKHGHSIGICWDLMKCAKAELNKLAKQQPAPRPVPTATPMSERLPVHTDADYSGLILAFTRFTKEWVLQAWTHVHNCPNAYTHWQRTGLVRPAEPDGGAV